MQVKRQMMQRQVTRQQQMKAMQLQKNPPLVEGGLA